MTNKKKYSLKESVQALRSNAPGGLSVMHEQSSSIAVLLENFWLKAFAPEGAGTEIVRFACEGKNHEDLLQVLGDQDLFGGPKVFILRDCEKLNVKKPDLALPEGGRYLFLYRGRAVPSWLQKWSKQLGVVPVKSKEPETRDFATWAAELFDLLGFRFSPGQSQKLVRFYQENTTDLIQLLQKLKLFKNEKSEVSSSDFETFLQAQPARHFFTLSNLLLDLKFAEASHFVRSLRSKGESEYAVLGFLASFLRRAAVVAELAPSAKSAPSVPPFLLKKYRVFSNRVGLAKIRGSIRALAYYDLHWKTAQSSPSLDVDNLLFSMG